jgi:hypothetical protein
VILLRPTTGNHAFGTPLDRSRPWVIWLAQRWNEIVRSHDLFSPTQSSYAGNASEARWLRCCCNSSARRQSTGSSQAPRTLCYGRTLGSIEGSRPGSLCGSGIPDKPGQSSRYGRAFVSKTGIGIGLPSTVPVRCIGRSRSQQTAHGYGIASGPQCGPLPVKQMHFALAEMTVALHWFDTSVIVPT